MHFKSLFVSNMIVGVLKSKIYFTVWKNWTFPLSDRMQFIHLFIWSTKKNILWNLNEIMGQIESYGTWKKTFQIVEIRRNLKSLKAFYWQNIICKCFQFKYWKPLVFSYQLFSGLTWLAGNAFINNHSSAVAHVRK